MKALGFIVLACSIGLAGCSGQATREDQPPANAQDVAELGEQLQQAKGNDELGQFIRAVHDAGVEYGKANQVYAQGNSASSSDVSSAQQAMSKANEHEQTARRALEQILEPVHLNSANIEYNRRRIEHLDALHLPEGVLPPTANVYFNFGSSHFRPQEQEKIRRIISFVRDYPLFSIELQGYADTVGSKAANRMLAERRNQSVLRILYRLGMPKATVVNIAVGEAEGPDEYKNAENRRVEIRPYVHGRYISAEPSSARHDPNAWSDNSDAALSAEDKGEATEDAMSVNAEEDAMPVDEDAQADSAAAKTEEFAEDNETGVATEEAVEDAAEKVEEAETDAATEKQAQASYEDEYGPAPIQATRRF